MPSQVFFIPMKNIIVILSLAFANVGLAQENIPIYNNSFEAVPYEGYGGMWDSIRHWHVCSYTPDIINATEPQNYYYNNRPSPVSGNTYLQLTSCNDAFESVSQTFSSSFIPLNPYYFTVYAAHPILDSLTGPINYGRVEFWLGYQGGVWGQHIYSSPILCPDWRQLTVSFEANEPYNTLFIRPQDNSFNIDSCTNAYVDFLSPFIYTGYPTSMSQPSTNEAGIKVFPNPSEGIYTLAQPSVSVVQVLDLAGHVLVVYPSATTRLDLTALPAGVYVLSIGEDKQKLIKL